MLEIEKPPPWNSSGFNLPARARAGQILHLPADRRQPLVVGLANDRRDQPFRDGDRDADIDVVVESHPVIGPARIHRRHFPQCRRRSLDHHVVDGDHIRARRVLRRRLRVQLPQQRDHGVDLDVHRHVEMRDGRGRFAQAPAMTFRIDVCGTSLCGAVMTGAVALPTGGAAGGATAGAATASAGAARAHRLSAPPRYPPAQSARSARCPSASTGRSRPAMPSGAPEERRKSARRLRA